MTSTGAQIQSNITASLPERITADFRLKIASGGWQAGSPLPSRRDLAKSYGVALRTIEQAMSPLIGEGLVEPRGARGTFVASRGDALRVDPAAASAGARATANDRVGGISIGIIGTWSGIPGEFEVEGIGARAIEREAAAHPNVSLHYFNCYVARNEPNIAMDEAARSLIGEGVDAIISFEIRNAYDTRPEWERFLTLTDSAGVPVILFNSIPGQMQVRHVISDDQFAGYEAARHLLARGWNSIVYLSPFVASWADDRLEGVRQAMHANSSSVVKLTVLPEQDRRTVQTEFGDYQAAGRTLGERLLRDLDEPVGIVTCNDMVAYGVLDVAQDLGLRVGNDFAIIGFDDYIYSRNYGLSSVRPPIEQIGAECVDVLLKAVTGQRSPLVVKLRSEVVARASTARMKQAGNLFATISREGDLVL